MFNTINASGHVTATKFPKYKVITKYLSRQKRSPSNLLLIRRQDYNFICTNKRIPLLRRIIARNIFTDYKRGNE